MKRLPFFVFAMIIACISSSCSKGYGCYVVDASPGYMPCAVTAVNGSVDVQVKTSGVCLKAIPARP